MEPVFVLRRRVYCEGTIFHGCLCRRSKRRRNGDCHGHLEMELSDSKGRVFYEVVMDIKIYQTVCSEAKVFWTKHCLERMQERDISRDDVKRAIATGEIIEEYPDDFPNPSCLIYGKDADDDVLHVVAGCDNAKVFIITAYYPDTGKFEDDLKTRRKD